MRAVSLSLFNATGLPKQDYFGRQMVYNLLYFIGDGLPLPQEGAATTCQPREFIDRLAI